MIYTIISVMIMVMFIVLIVAIKTAQQTGKALRQAAYIEYEFRKLQYTIKEIRQEIATVVRRFPIESPEKIAAALGVAAEPPDAYLTELRKQVEHARERNASWKKTKEQASQQDIEIEQLVDELNRLDEEFYNQEES